MMQQQLTNERKLINQNCHTDFVQCLQSVKELEGRNASISQGGLYGFQIDVINAKSVRKSREIVDTVSRERNLDLHYCQHL